MSYKRNDARRGWEALVTDFEHKKEMRVIYVSNNAHVTTQKITENVLDRDWSRWKFKPISDDELKVHKQDICNSSWFVEGSAMWICVPFEVRVVT